MVHGSAGGSQAPPFPEVRLLSLLSSERERKGGFRQNQREYLLTRKTFFLGFVEVRYAFNGTAPISSRLIKLQLISMLKFAKLLTGVKPFKCAIDHLLSSIPRD